MATEQLYRMGNGGILEAVQPEGRGRAEAMRTFLARGGGLSKSGRYRSGPMKGKTVQEASTMFEDHWAGASGAVKDKYAARARDILSPSEKREAGIGTPAPPKPAGKMYADQKASRMAYYSRINGVQPARDTMKAGTSKIVQGPPAPSKGDEAETASQRASHGSEESGEYAPGSDEARAAALTENSRNERFATADINGMSGFAAANAMANSRDMSGDRAAIETVGKIMTAKTPPPGSPSAASPAVVAPSSSQPSQKMPTAGTPVTNGMQTDERMHAQGKTNAGTTPVVKAPPTPPQIAGVNPAPKINRLTGMPFGAMPGETAGMNPAQIATAKTMADQRASQGMPTATPRDIAGATRMMQADGVIKKPQIAGVTPAPRPVSMSRPDGYQATSQRQDWDRENASAATRASAKVANPSDPKKFFTGRVLPLNQLVKR